MQFLIKISVHVKVRQNLTRILLIICRRKVDDAPSTAEANMAYMAMGCCISCRYGASAIWRLMGTTGCPTSSGCCVILPHLHLLSSVHNITHGNHVGHTQHLVSSLVYCNLVSYHEKSKFQGDSVFFFLLLSMKMVNCKRGC